MNTKDSKSRPDHVARHLVDLPRSGIRDFFEIVSSMHDVISLGIGEPDFDTPWHVREACYFGLERGATHYTSNLGLPKLRTKLAEYVRGQFGMTYDPLKEMIVTVGVSEALDLAVRALINPGDEVLYHEPCYVSYAPLVMMAHGRPVAVPTTAENGFRLTREALEEGVTDKTRLLLLNYPNNPTGGHMDRADMEAVAEFAQTHDLMVVTDDIYAELTYEGEHVSVASLPGMRERTIFLHGFSKAWAMTGFRMGYACAPNEWIEAMMKIHQYTMLCAPSVSQEAAVEALSQPEQDIALMRTEYLARRNLICSIFDESGIPCYVPGGAFYVFPDIRATGLTSHEFSMRLLEEKKVAVVPGSAFGPSGEGHVRCSYATAMSDLKEAAERIADFVKSRRS